MTSMVPALAFALFAFVSPLGQAGATAVRFQLVTPVTGPLDDDEVKNAFQHHLDGLRQCAANDDWVKRNHRQLQGSVQFDITISHGTVDSVRVHGASWLTNGPNDFAKCAKEQVISKLTFSAKDTPSHALVNVIVN
jgi:hypothetical protein